MARESQGLQIALVSFVILTLFLGVVAFLFYKQYDETAKKLEEALAEARKNTEAARNAIAENERLKEYIGVAASLRVDEIGEEVRRDFETYAPNFPGETRSYRAVVEYLGKTLRAREEALNSALAENEQLKTQIRQLEASKAPLVDQERARAESATSQLAAERLKFNEARQRLQDQAQQLQVRMDTVQKEAAEKVAAAEAKLAEERKRLQTTLSLLRERTETLRRVTEPTFERPDGFVRWVNQRARTVWISLGSADGLQRQTTFAVYPSTALDVGKAQRKGSIEVTEILGDHLAEARILEDNPADPIMPGDLIHTPVWTPGERQRFALADGMDIDGDGRSDLEIVLNIIRSNGALVDCYIDDEGNKTGEITTETRYLVLGVQPDETASEARRKARTDLLRTADVYGLTKITLQELLARMGWSVQTPVIRYGSGANPADFRARPPGGVPPVSRQPVSEIFQPRTPPSRPRGY
jgi:hypothetical protein